MLRTVRLRGIALVLLVSSHPASLAAQAGATVSVRFFNPGPAAQRIFKLDQATGQEVPWGGFGDRDTTPAIPSLEGEVWRFRLVSNNRLVEDYRVSNAPQQYHEVQGYLVNAEEPRRGFVEGLLRDLASAVQGAWQKASPTVTPVVTSGLVAIRDVSGLEAKVNADLQSHQQELKVLLDWYFRFGHSIDPLAVRDLLGSRNGQALASLMHLTELTASLRASADAAPGAPTIRPAAYAPGAPTSPDQLVSLGLTGHGAAFIAGNGEAGMVWETNGNPLPVGFYTTSAHGFGLSLGVDAGLALSTWQVGLAGFVGKSTSVGLGVRGIDGVGIAIWYTCGAPGAFILFPFSSTDCPITVQSQYMGLTLQGGAGLSVTAYEVNVGVTRSVH